MRDSRWPPRAQYRAYPDLYNYTIRLRPLAAGDDPAALARQELE